jgi:hypothetical protein
VVEAHEIHVLVEDALEESLDVLHLQRHAVLTLIVRRDAGDTASLILVWLGSAATICVTLTASADSGATLDDFCPAVLALAAPDVLMIVLVDKKLGAADTDTPENAEDLGQELNEEYRAC